MIKHYITKYVENNELIVEAWLQINFLGMIWCFSKRKIKVPKSY